MSADQVYDMVNVLNTISYISNRVLSSSQRKLFLNCFFSLDGTKMYYIMLAKVISMTINGFFKVNKIPFNFKL